MLKEERQQEIINILNASGYVEVSQLCRLFQVTEMTIRRDLNELSQRKVLVRSHGGAILPPDTATNESPYAVRILDNLDAKKAIAGEALKFVRDGERIYFDSSTSVYCLAQILSNSQIFLAVTDTVFTAMELMTRTQIKVVLIGGELQKTTGACTGVFADEMYERMSFDTAFIGVSNISADGQITTGSLDEFKAKRCIIQRSRKVVLLADSSKIGGDGFLRTCSLKEIDAIITDSGVSPNFVSFCKKQKIRLIVAK